MLDQLCEISGEILLGCNPSVTPIISYHWLELKGDAAVLWIMRRGYANWNPEEK